MDRHPTPTIHPYDPGRGHVGSNLNYGESVIKGNGAHIVRRERNYQLP